MMGKALAWCAMAAVSYVAGCYVTTKALDKYVDWKKHDEDQEAIQAKRKETREFVKKIMES